MCKERMNCLLLNLRLNCCDIVAFYWRMDYFRRERIKQHSNGPVKINFTRLSRVSTKQTRVSTIFYFRRSSSRTRSESGDRRSRSLDRKSRHEESHASENRGRSSSPKTSTVAIFNLSYKADEREINRIFARYGPIKVFLLAFFFFIFL